MKSLNVSVMASIYLIYMFRYFKTSINLSIWSLNSNLFKHSLTSEYGLKICPFGQQVIFFLVGFLILQHFIKISKPLRWRTWYLILLLSLLNTNATFYILPVFILDEIIS